LLQTLKPTLRAKNFTFKAEGKVIREFQALHFDKWLGYNQKASSVDATLRQFAEFITFCKAKHKQYIGCVPVLLCSVLNYVMWCAML
jgi:hypothetical protein